MKILVKIGGTLIDDPAIRRALAAQIAGILTENTECVVVHGGGKQITRFLEDRGVESRFVNGLRVTTPETMDAVLKVLAGTVNQELVAALIGAGTKAVGLTGLDANLVDATQMSPELGAVGKVTGANPALLNLLTAQKYLPVVACLAGDRAGNFYNVNADQMAVACAAGFHAERIVFLTDVEGVLDAGGERIPELNLAGIRDLIATGVAKGGMEAKLNAAAAALEQGIAHVHIVSGRTPDVLQGVLDGKAIGTRIAESAESKESWGNRK